MQRFSLPASIWILIVLNVCLYLIPLYTVDSNTGRTLYDTWITQYAKDNYAIVHGGEWYRVVTSAFLHGSGLHLFMNMYALYAVGPAVVAMFRTAGFWLIYLVSAVAGSLASVYITAYLLVGVDSRALSVGASGAIFGLIGASLAYFFVTKNRVLQREFAGIIALNLVIGFVPGTNIDNWAHLGGLLAGIVCGFLLPKRRDQFIDEV
jgi:rhomboid protease GluP